MIDPGAVYLGAHVRVTEPIPDISTGAEYVGLVGTVVEHWYDRAGPVIGPYRSHEDVRNSVILRFPRGVHSNGKRCECGGSACCYDGPEEWAIYLTGGILLDGLDDNVPIDL